MCSRPDRARSDSPPRRSPRRPHRRSPVPAGSCARALEPATRVDNQSQRQQIAALLADPQRLVEPPGPRRPPIHAAFAVQSRSVHAARRRVGPR
jgi:hypothetical protein